MNLVIDASVVIKAYIPEILSDRVEELMAAVATGELTLLAPDLLYPETGNILWKKRQRQELLSEEVEEIINAISALPLRVERSGPIMPLAISIAMDLGITVYDAMYVAVAMVYESRMITADKKLVDALTKTECARYVMWLGGPLSSAGR